jgi:hypothetical protein
LAKLLGGKVHNLDADLGNAQHHGHDNGSASFSGSSASLTPTVN